MLKSVIILALCVLLCADTTNVYSMQRTGQGIGLNGQIKTLAEATESNTEQGSSSETVNTNDTTTDHEKIVVIDNPNGQTTEMQGAEDENPVKEEPVKPEGIQITDYVEELKKLGYYQEEPKDAKLAIRNAVTLFQSDHNLIVDGRVGKKSLEVLKKRRALEKFIHSDKVKKPANAGQWLTINKSKRILTLYEGSQVLKKYPVAIGNPPSLTPEGKYKIIVKAVDPTWGGGGYAKPVKGGSPDNPLGKRWMGLSLKGGYSYGIHGNNRPYSIGTNASHGCIRMINYCVEELYEWVDKNTEVWIGTDKKLVEWGVRQDTY
jgi:lipoprotein-anchoring transpeptidase ErfK/SrfK